MKHTSISFEEALKIVSASSLNRKKERVTLEIACNRILSEDVFSDIDMPPFNKSAMDGFACKLSDINNTILIIEDLPAGSIPQKPVSHGECSRIMTGSMVPEGADCVIPVEDVEIIGNTHIRFIGKKQPGNICYRAEDLRAGMQVLSAGTLLRPPHIAILASVGCVNPLVFNMPVVSVISTGNEIVEPSEAPPTGKIRNSNAAQIAAQAKDLGCAVRYFGIVKDDLQETIDILSRATQNSDVVILSGGVSMGDYDFVPEAMKQCGYKTHFDSIAIQPGRPTVFASTNDTYAVGLPGNPVSSFVVFELLVKPLLFALCGYLYKEKGFMGVMAKDYKRKRAERKAFIPITYNNEGLVDMPEYHGSAHIHALTNANGLISIDPGVLEIEKGEKVYVRQI